MSVSAKRIDRIGLPAFLEAIEIDPDPNMVNHPRTSSYVRTDDFTDEAEKYFERKAREAQASTLQPNRRSKRAARRAQVRRRASHTRAFGSDRE